MFELSLVETIWTETILLSCSCGQPASTGIFPVNGLIMDAGGNFFGTTSANGPYSEYVFELSPSGGGWRVPLAHQHRNFHRIRPFRALIPI